MDIRDLETFLMVVQTGSLSRTAERLHLTQPGVSKRIRHVEEEFSCRLFERVGNQFLLTKSGQLVCTRVEELLRSLQELRQQLAAQEGRLQSLTIALSNSLGHSAFTARMRQLKSHFPFVEHLQLRLLSSARVSESVLRGESDVGVRFFRDDETRLTYEQIAHEQLVVVSAAHSQWLPPEEPLTPELLSTLPWVTLPTTGSAGSSVPILTAFLEAQLASLGIRPVRTLEIDGFPTSKTMVESDFGLALLPSSHVQDDLQKGTLQKLSPPYEATIPLYSVYRKNFHHIETLQEVVAFLFPAPDTELI